jgi:hypothetical protein
VELFSAMEKGQIDVKLLPKDSTQCRIFITNKTDKPLSIKLPEAFAGVPVLAQAAGGGAAGGGAGRSHSNNQEQSTGGGMGMMGGMGGMGGGGGMGMFNIAPEKVGQLKATTVCLDHGLREPRPNVPYQIKPIESATSKPAVQMLCKLVGQGALSQRAAQVAAWHLNNNMSLEQLAAKRLHYANGTSAPYFSAQELQAGMAAISLSTRLAEQQRLSQPTSAYSTSASQQ